MWLFKNKFLKNLDCLGTSINERKGNIHEENVYNLGENNLLALDLDMSEAKEMKNLVVESII